MFEHIILKCLEPAWKILDLGDRSDYVYNRDLLCTFQLDPVIPIADLAILFRTPKNVEYGTTGGGEFGAKRAGEMVRWGMDNGVVSHFFRDGVMHFRLLESEPLYVLVGAKTNRRQVRTRRWRSAEEEAHAKKELKREAARLERARKKAVAMLRRDVDYMVSFICTRAPETQATGPLLRFTVPGVTKIIEIAGLLLERFDDLSEADAAEIAKHLEPISREVMSRIRSELQAMALQDQVAKRAAPPQQLDDEDLDILGDF